MANPIVVGAVMPDFVYSTRTGESRHLADLWADQPALVLWLRHFG